MWYQTRSFPILMAATIALAAIQTAGAAIIATGDYDPDPLCDANNVVNSEMQLGNTFLGTASLTVDDGDTLTTSQGSYVCYSSGSTASVTVTDANWVAESSVFIAPEFYNNGTVTLSNSTWTVTGMTIAQGDESTANVALNNNSFWTTSAAVRIAQGEDCTGTITINSGTWTSQADVELGGTGFSGSNGSGLIDIKSSGLMNALGGLEITACGELTLDGGTLSLSDASEFEGALTATGSGGTLELNVDDAAANGTPLLLLGPDVDFTACDLEIMFESEYTANPLLAYDVLDPIGAVNLAAVLGAANSITVPANWQLDLDTGVLSYVPEPTTLALLLPGLLLRLRRARRR